MAVGGEGRQWGSTEPGRDKDDLFEDDDDDVDDDKDDDEHDDDDEHVDDGHLECSVPAVSKREPRDHRTSGLGSPHRVT